MFTKRHGELTQQDILKIRGLHLPKPVQGRWWIHLAHTRLCPYNGVKFYIYDNYGQPFIKKVPINKLGLGPNFIDRMQRIDPIFKQPLPDYLIDFVKKQGIVQDLNLLADDCAFNIDVILEPDEEIAVNEKSNTETILRNAGLI